MLIAYLREHRRGAVLFLLCAAIYAGTFLLYRLPWQAVLYPTLLCAALCGAFFAAGYARAARKHRQLQRLRAAVPLPMEFPVSETVDDADYREIIGLLQEEQRHLTETTDARYTAMVDYYTVWAHQIKTPIASMRLHLENDDTPLSRQLTADLNHVEQYVEMVLTFLRLDADSTDYVFRAFSLDTLVRQAVRRFSGEFIMRRLTLTYDPCTATVITDEKWMGFVLEQVLSNALKYTRRGGITITQEGERTLCVRDTGIGITAEDLPRIFDEGYTGFNGRTDRKASGIGLYLCRRICTALGVAIRVTSEPDVGTAVYLEFPESPATHE